MNQCKGCCYWRDLRSGYTHGGDWKACHYMLDKGHRRKMGPDGVCLSREEAPKRKRGAQ